MWPLLKKLWSVDAAARRERLPSSRITDSAMEVMIFTGRCLHLSLGRLV